MKLAEALFLPLLVLLLGGCSNPNQNIEILPMTLGDWKRMAVENIPAEEHTEELKRMGIKRSRRAIYQSGDNRVTIAVYEYGAGAAAFEMVQKWRPQPGKIVTSQGAYFVILESQTVDATGLNRVASLLEGILRE